MFFSVGVETPKDETTAYGLIVPALCNDNYGCFSAADTQEDIPVMAREVILAIVEEMVIDGKQIDAIKDAGHLLYSANPEYADYDSWFVIDVDLSEFEGKQQRINISLPDTLIKRIDIRVKEHPAHYRDRSHFLAEAARNELSAD
ncbi:TPA: type II toxin-antitoxin system HicB family antitoxin [Salmonella enterica]|nr:type II toxin-antitoxin system HicB family antitoxin [Salmonella enterica]MCH5739604.1 type II toxin-antitoxin system HicB family antitoxin [Salmonella enterica]MCH5744698.1 type II toxin-antitoxin system HicB family antitoxin [Salmonella enterica]MCH5749657.1 type II toxin-antitoxin system HicB family antitoxin [Salmonella enterica]MCH5757149.1 type II toxin-antitoxin system HicB family antitoxin [Salmonella enterica]